MKKPGRPRLHTAPSPTLRMLRLSTRYGGYEIRQYDKKRGWLLVHATNLDGMRKVGVAYTRELRVLVAVAQPGDSYYVLDQDVTAVRAFGRVRSNWMVFEGDVFQVQADAKPINAGDVLRELEERRRAVGTQLHP